MLANDSRACCESAEKVGPILTSQETFSTLGPCLLNRFSRPRVREVREALSLLSNARK